MNDLTAPDLAAHATPATLRIGELLIAAGIVNRTQVDMALAVQRAGIREPLGHILIAHGAASADAIEAAIAESTSSNAQASAPVSVKPSLCRLLGVKVLGLRGDTLKVSALDELSPADEAALMEAARDATGQEVNAIGIEAMDRFELMTWLHGAAGVDIPEIESDLRRLASQQEIDGVLLNQVIRRVLEFAIDEQASDIHFERADRLTTCIAIRQDGILHRILPTHPAVMAALLARIKAMSNMDLTDVRRDQDGRMSLEHLGRSIFMRASTKPSAAGESLVVRIQDPNNLHPITFLMAAHPEVARRLHDIASNLVRGGRLVLFTGPIGSGKSQSMAGMMLEMPRFQSKIVTIEDPVEMSVPLVIHTSVNELLGADYARGIRGTKRQDANGVVIGEVRDVETAQEAIRIGQAGHLTLATLHTDSAKGTLPALISYFADHPFLPIARTELPHMIRAVVNQRLIPRLCAACRRPHTPDERMQAFIAALEVRGPFYHAEGCDRCRGSGISGRVVAPDALFFPDTPEVRHELLHLAHEHRLQDAPNIPGVTHYTRRHAIKALLEQGLISLQSAELVLEE